MKNSNKRTNSSKQKNGLLIAGIIVAACGLITLAKHFGAGLAALAVGALLIVWHFLRKKKYSSNVAPAENAAPAENVSSKADLLENESNEGIATFKIVGVTFNNEDGTSRQEKLREISESPESYEYTFSRREYEGRPAYGFYVFDSLDSPYMLGNISSDDSEYFGSLFDRITGIYNVVVYGGYKGKSYGCRVTIRYRN